MTVRPNILEIQPYTAGERRTGAIKLASNENPLGPSPKAIEAMGTALSEAHLYPDGAITLLREAIANRHQVHPDQIIVGNGSDEVLTLIAATYLHPGDKTLVGEHTFSQYTFSTLLFDGRPIRVPMPQGRFELERFSVAIRTHKPRIVFFCSPNNPTATVIDRREFVDFMDAVSPETLVVVDHAYQDYVDDPDAMDAHRYVNEYPNLVVLRTFSKIFGLASLRVGYGVAQKPMIDEINRTRSPFNVGGLAQVAAAAAIGDTEFLERSVRSNKLGRDRFQEYLGTRGYKFWPSQANFVSFHVRREARGLAEECASRGVTIRPLTSFGYPNAVRVTVGSSEQLDRFFTAFESIGES